MSYDYKLNVLDERLVALHKAVDDVDYQVDKLRTENRAFKDTLANVLRQNTALLEDVVEIKQILLEMITRRG